MVDISVVIVNYNVKNLIDNCLASIYKASLHSALNTEIFVVDNNSIDGSVSMIREKYPSVILIPLDANIGFSKANNIALKQASGKYILILNPDTVLEENTFTKMIAFCEKHKDTGAVTSKLILANGKLDSACKRSFPTPSVAIPRMLGLSRLFPNSKLFGKYNLTYLDENKTYEVDAICGAFMFIPKKVLDEVGLFDEDYFMYGEDLDLSYRINKAGYKIFYYPEVTTIHLKGESTKKTNLSYVNNFYGAMGIFVRKNFTGFSRLLSPVLRIGIFYRSLLSYIKRIFIQFLGTFADIIIIFGSLIFSVYNRFHIFPNEQYLFIISVYVVIWIILLTLFGVYIRKNRLSLLKVFTAIIFGFFVNSSITYFFKEYAFSREVILMSTVLSLIGLFGWRLIFIIKNFFESKNILLNKSNLLIVGNKELVVNLEDKFHNKYNILYLNEISSNTNIESLNDIILINNINFVVFTDDTFSNQEILSTMWFFRDKNVEFKILPSGNDLILSRIRGNIDGISLIEIEYNINNKINIFLKRIFDIILSFLLLLTVYPFIWIKNKLFKKDLSKQTSKILLLPQVLSGKYSFVGYPVWYDTNGNKYPGKKGLTGLIQLYYYEGMNGEEMENYNVFYAKNQSLALDTEIILKTIFSLRK
ncbi:MAG TPA: glycosyltransferase [Ignavibacteria bacterium]|nr:glycosyltransferase [Ignavibacteria bacterium]